jgi:predicted Zn-dependent protease with MMP-like domain
VESDPLDPAERFEGHAQDALASLPSELRARMSNLEIVVEDEPPPGLRLLGLGVSDKRLIELDRY